jgi:restriction system protein
MDLLSVARRRRTRSDLDIAEAFGSLILLGLFLSFFVPGARQAILGLGAILLSLIALVGVGFIVYRIIQHRRQRAERERETVIRAFELNRIARGSAVSLPQESTSPILRVDTSGYVPPSKPEPEPLRTTDLVARLHSIDWFQFEKIVAITYRKLGYSVTAKGGANPDGGIDLVLSKDGLTTAVQCKQWKTWNVGVKAIREFLGALTDAGIQKGIFVTLRGYTGDAKALADKHGIEILNETKLAGMLEATNARFDPETLELLNDTRKFCPKCGREMVLKTATKVKGAGQEFWACPGYPWHCRYTLPVAQ